MAKLRPDELNTVLSLVSSTLSRDPSVVLGPAIGEDAAVISIGGEYIVVHSNPITGAVDLLGWLAIHIPCNDVAATGARPRWLLVTLLLPEGFTGVERIVEGMVRAARELGVAVIGGHTEYAPGVPRPIASSTAIGIGVRGRYIPTSGARPGDVILATKSAAIEAAAIAATDFRDKLLAKGVPVEVVEKASKLYSKISIVREALALAEKELVDSMHDPTEGGVLGGLAEIAYASKVTIEVWEDRIPVYEEVKAVLEPLNINPLRALSSGMLLAAVPSEKAEEALKTLSSVGVEAAIIGRAIDYDGSLVRLHRRGGGVETISKPYVEDELMKLW